jgi:alkylation response protein AidB-like acyl-CoA dehydrogenase
MNFSIPDEIVRDRDAFKDFLRHSLIPGLPEWYRKQEYPPDFFGKMAEAGWLGFYGSSGEINKHSALREAMIMETLAEVSPGMAVSALVVSDLGLIGLYLFGSDFLKKTYAEAALNGEKLICLGNTENIAGSDVAGIGMSCKKADGGWVLNGTKAYVTNGSISHLAVVTAVSDPEAERNRRLSMFLVDLFQPGVHRKRLNKQVWIPSDLTRLTMENVFVPESHLLGHPGNGLQQVLRIFSHSRVPISALTLGTAQGAFDKALSHTCKRRIFNKKLVNFQAKAFEAADFHARIEAARLMLQKASQLMDEGGDFRMAASMAKYLAVQIAREVTVWSADIFGAASVMYEHPIHKYAMDAWGASLGEGTQDVQKLVIFREMMREKFGITPEI